MVDKNEQEVVDFPIVGLGASAGGLEPLCAFFDMMPANSGMAFVVILHLFNGRESILADVLQRHTSMVVLSISQDMPMQPNYVYVLPADYEVEIQSNKFQLTPYARRDGWPNTINRFFQSLALHHSTQAVAIILSGEGTDGLDGARAIKEHRGLVIAQDPASATHDGMPSNVIEIADAVVRPEHMAEFLRDYFDFDISPANGPFDDLTQRITEDDLKRVIARIRRHTGYDFGEYKASTMRRQIARRIGEHNLSSVGEYIEKLDQNPAEAMQLVGYLLIHVTNFFRDPEAFEALKKDALMPLLESLNIDEIFRGWIPGCATGEEAVSIAILIHECLKELDMQEMEVRIFGTDIDRGRIEQARRGIYPLSIAENISESRLRENFIKHGDAYEVRNHISQMLIWSEHNLFEHPPFSRLNLISCRNVIIYFERTLQERIMSLFQFALRPGGVLFLGPSETIADPVNAFMTINSKHKIYRRTARSSRAWMQLDKPLFFGESSVSEQPVPTQTEPQYGHDGESHDLEVIKKMLVAHYDSTCVIVDDNYMVRYTYGEVDRYLRLVPGRTTPRNILEMAREGLDIELTIGLHAAFEKNETITRNNVWVRTNGDERIINLVVKPVLDPLLDDRHKLIIFEPVHKGTNLQEESAEAIANSESTVVIRLRDELRQTQESLQRVTQALQAKTEELTSSMEEIRSANEEVQTTNEELRTSKEELESMNEELNTLNTQLTDQNKELARANDTLSNFLQSTEIGVIFLDQHFMIREYTQAATNIFNLRKSDIGRPLSEITSRLVYDGLIEDATSVLDTLVNVEKEVKTTEGQQFEVMIRPYRTTTNVIDGLVLTFKDVTKQREAQQQAEVAASYIRQMLDTVDNGLLELDADLRVVSANQSFYDKFQVEPEETIGRKLHELGNGQWDIPDLRRLLKDVIPEEIVVKDFTVTHDFPELGRRTMRLNARQIDEMDRILLVITDVSEDVDEESES